MTAPAPEPETPVATTTPDGATKWLLNGRLHRVDGPAVIKPDGRTEWWFRGRLHRVDGPAYTPPEGIHEWWWHGSQVPGTATATLDELAATEPELLAAMAATWTPGDDLAALATAARAALT